MRGAGVSERDLLTLARDARDLADRIGNAVTTEELIREARGVIADAAALPDGVDSLMRSRVVLVASWILEFVEAMAEASPADHPTRQRFVQAALTLHQVTENLRGQIANECRDEAA